MSTVAIFGAAAFWEVTPAEADAAMERVIAAGVNHIDVVPSYGLAEERLGPWMTRERDRFFLGCKTMERTREAAASELRRSLERLRVDRFDLYQLHAVTTLEELDVFPINFVQFANPAYRRDAEELLRVCRAKDVGTMIIKSITRGPWADLPQTHTTWYRPFTEVRDVQRAVDFALSYDVTGICTAGDTRLLPLVLEACERFTAMGEAEREALIATASEHEPLFA